MIGHDRVWQVVFASSLPGLPGGSHGSQGSTKGNIDADAQSETHHRESRAKSEGRRIHTRKQALPSRGIGQDPCDGRFVCHDRLHRLVLGISHVQRNHSATAIAEHERGAFAGRVYYRYSITTLLGDFEVLRLVQGASGISATIKRDDRELVRKNVRHRRIGATVPATARYHEERWSVSADFVIQRVAFSRHAAGTAHASSSSSSCRSKADDAAGAGNAERYQSTISMRASSPSTNV